MVVEQNDNSVPSTVESKSIELPGPGVSAAPLARRTRRDTPIAVAKPNKEKKKKDAQLVLRLNKDMRDNFVAACQDLDTSAAREVRRFIKKFIKEYERGDFDD